MYILTGVVLLVAAILTAMDRSWRRSAPLLFAFGSAAFAIFAVVTGLLWLVAPATTVSFVPGHTQSSWILLLAQARGIIVLTLGVLVWGARYTRQRETPIAALIGPFVYNLLMAGETLRAQFSAVGTLERWLYVSLHVFWAVTFGMQLFQKWRGGISASLTARAFACYAAAGGCVLLFGFPFFERLLVPGAAPFWEHASHGVGAAVLAFSAVAWTRYPVNGRSDWTWYGLTLANVGLAFLALVRLASGLRAPELWIALLVEVAWSAAFVYELQVTKRRTPIPIRIPQ